MIGAGLSAGKGQPTGYPVQLFSDQAINAAGREQLEAHLGTYGLGAFDKTQARIWRNRRQNRQEPSQPSVVKAKASCEDWRYTNWSIFFMRKEEGPRGMTPLAV